MKKLIIAAACVVALASCANDNKSTTNATTTTTPTAPANAPVNTPAPAPAAGTVQTVSTDGQGQIQMAPPAGQPNAASPDAGVAPKSGTINPPHGQPGHSCAVQVGQPIP